MWYSIQIIIQINYEGKVVVTYLRDSRHPGGGHEQKSDVKVVVWRRLRSQGRSDACDRPDRLNQTAQGRLGQDLEPVR